MSVLEIILYSGLAIITTIIIVKTILKAVKIRKEKKQNENSGDDQNMQSK